MAARSQQRLDLAQHGVGALQLDILVLVQIEGVAGRGAGHHLGVGVSLVLQAVDQPAVVAVGGQFHVIGRGDLQAGAQGAHHRVQHVDLAQVQLGGVGLGALADDHQLPVGLALHHAQVADDAVGGRQHDVAHVSLQVADQGPVGLVGRGVGDESHLLGHHGQGRAAQDLEAATGDTAAQQRGGGHGIAGHGQGHLGAAELALELLHDVHHVLVLRHEEQLEHGQQEVGVDAIRVQGDGIVGRVHVGIQVHVLQILEILRVDLPAHDVFHLVHEIGHRGGGRGVGGGGFLGGHGIGGRATVVIVGATAPHQQGQDQQQDQREFTHDGHLRMISVGRMTRVRPGSS